MKAPAFAGLRGYVRASLRGGQIETFINATALEQIRIWDVRRLRDGRAECYLTASDYLRLRPLLKKTGCRIHVEQRFGLPFSIVRIRRRKFFAMGGILFLLGLYMLSSLVWSIEVTGNIRISTEEVLKQARQQGIYPFQWTFRLRDPDAVSKAMNMQLKGVSWIGIERNGTRIRIHVVESTLPENKGLVNPRHLVAKTDGIITHIITERGRPAVRQHSRVKKGDILISGQIGTEELPSTVAAKGEVRGLVWHEYDVAAPLVTKRKVYTGEQKELRYVTAGDRRLQIAGYGGIPFDSYETIVVAKRLQWRQWVLPFGWQTEVLKEAHIISEERSEQEAAAAGLQEARADVLAKNGPDARIHEEKILHQKADNGKVVMKVLFEVEQSIAEELTIVPQAQPDPGAQDEEAAPPQARG